MNTAKIRKYWSIPSMNLRFALIVSVVLIALLLMFWLISYIWWPDWTGFNSRSLWDVLDLAIVPLALAGGVYWLNRQQKDRELEIVAQQKARELEIANDQKQENALQTYIDCISDLLLNHQLREKAENSALENSTIGVRSIAQARTSIVLRDLNDIRRGMLVRFLYESGLIAKNNPIIILKGVYLMQAVLTNTNLTNANLAGALLMGARLTGACLTGACLTGAHLMRANMTGATLRDADLTGADLTDAGLVGVRYNESTAWPQGFPLPINFKDP